MRRLSAMTNDIKNPAMQPPAFTTPARTVLVAFILTFALTRLTVFMIMSCRIPDLFLYVGGAHVHHLNYGIFLLSGIGGYLLLRRPEGRTLRISSAIYGIGLALTFDEFGMWLHLGGSYWQRASWDAVTVLSAAIALIAFAPSLKRFRPRHWLSAVALVLVVLVFFLMLIESFKYAGKIIEPKLLQIETLGPH